MPMAFTSRWKTRPKAIPSRPALPAIVLFGSLAGFSLACAGSKPPVEPSALPPRPARAIDVQLVFDEAADLDLHVTGPDLETIYFGNSPGRAGGLLDRDARCEDAPPGSGGARRETVRFDAPRPGRYRVGVDHVKGCRRFRSEASYTIRVVGPDLELERSGRIGSGRFENAALEFDWPAESTERAGGD